MDRYRIKLFKVEESIFYHGIARGSRADGLGIIFHKNKSLTIRGKFSNTKMNGIGKIELDNGEIYDGIFRNGIFCAGVFYSSKSNVYLFGNFKQQNLVLWEKGHNYPYKILLQNKMGLYPHCQIYKNTHHQLLFIPKFEENMIYQFNRNRFNYEESDIDLRISALISQGDPKEGKQLNKTPVSLQAFDSKKSSSFHPGNKMNARAQPRDLLDNHLSSIHQLSKKLSGIKVSDDADVGPHSFVDDINLLEEDKQQELLDKKRIIQDQSCQYEENSNIFQKQEDFLSEKG